MAITGRFALRRMRGSPPIPVDLHVEVTPLLQPENDRFKQSDYQPSPRVRGQQADQCSMQETAGFGSDFGANLHQSQQVEQQRKRAGACTERAVAWQETKVLLAYVKGVQAAGYYPQATI